MVLLFMSPWIIGFLAFTVYPMLSSLYFSFTKLRPAVDAALDRARELPLHVHEGSGLLDRDQATRVWIIVVGVPLRILVGDRHGVAARAPEARA